VTALVLAVCAVALSPIACRCIDTPTRLMRPLGWLIVAAYVALLVGALAAAASARPMDAHWCPAPGEWACGRAFAQSRAQLRRRRRNLVRARWRRTVDAYGPGLLAARAACESTSRYRLGTTGNGFWFAHQFEARAWTGAGGRYSAHLGRPVGRWTVQPGRLEQDYRAAIWDRRSEGDPWPNCP
jgi:hypothetical protein